MNHPDLRAAGTRDHPIPFAEFSPPYRVNFGCSQVKLNGYLNVDVVAEFEPDLVCDVGQTPMPFPDGSAAEIVMIHLLEHLPHHNLDHAQSPQRRFLHDCYRILRPGGTIQIVGPNIEFFCAELMRINKHLSEPEDPEGVAPAGMDPMYHYDGTVICFLSDQREEAVVDRPRQSEIQSFMRHWWLLTGEYIVELLRRAGFVDVNLDETWPKTEVSVMGLKP